MNFLPYCRIVIIDGVEHISFRSGHVQFIRPKVKVVSMRGVLKEKLFCARRLRVPCLVPACVLNRVICIIVRVLDVLGHDIAGIPPWTMLESSLWWENVWWPSEMRIVSRWFAIIIWTSTDLMVWNTTMKTQFRNQVKLGKTSGELKERCKVERLQFRRSFVLNMFSVLQRLSGVCWELMMTNPRNDTGLQAVHVIAREKHWRNGQFCNFEKNKQHMEQAPLKIKQINEMFRMTEKPFNSRANGKHKNVVEGL